MNNISLAGFECPVCTSGMNSHLLPSGSTRFECQCGFDTPWGRTPEDAIKLHSSIYQRLTGHTTSGIPLDSGHSRVDAIIEGYRLRCKEPTLNEDDIRARYGSGGGL